MSFRNIHLFLVTSISLTSLRATNSSCFLFPSFFSHCPFVVFAVALFIAVPDSAEGSSSCGRHLSAGRHMSPVRYPPLCEITTYLQAYRAYFGTDHFAGLPSAGAALTVLFGVGVRDAAAGAWRIRRRHWDGTGPWS